MIVRVSPLLMLGLVAGGCRDEQPERPAPPPAEFILAAGDSMFWVRSTPEGLSLRASPIHVARIEGRYYELYLADDDRSYPRAVFVGQRLYRRDLLSGDSVAIFTDTTVARLARQYARANPGERRLRPEEELAEEPVVEALAEIEVLDVHGAFVSIEYHLDQADPSGETHYVERAVVDARDGRRASLRELFGDSAARAIVAAGERALAEAIDSVLATRDVRARRAAPTLSDFGFDPRSFALAQAGAEVAVAFLAPGRGERAGGMALPLLPVSAGAPAWWQAIENELPTAGPGGSDQWTRAGYIIQAVYDESSDAMQLHLISQKNVWSAGPLSAPARRIYWLDSPAPDSVTMAGLRRAFDEAALYSDEARRAERPVDPRSVPARISLVTSEQ